MIAAKNLKETTIDIQGSERTFQLDRDTILVYTGIHSNDIRPFIRIGAGDFAPGGLVKHIENVVLTDIDPTNVGLEIFWLHSTLSRGGEIIRYIGSRDRISRLYSYTGMKEIEERRKPPVEILAYRQLRDQERNSKDKCLINFFETGNINVAVDGRNALDFTGYKKSILTIDKEYNLIARALTKRKCKCESGFGFLYFDTAKTPGVSLYWNMQGSGLFVNPPRDFHYHLFENAIKPDRLNMCIAATPYMPGFVEALRRRNYLGKDIGLYTPIIEKIADLKNIYNQAKIKPFNDGRPLPHSKETVFNVSKGLSHAVFSTKLSDEAEQDIQVLFPTGSGKWSKSFDYIRGPYDLEIGEIHTKEELKSGALNTHFLLHVPGRIKESAYFSARLQENSYPLIAEREYKFIYADRPVSLTVAVLDALSGSDYEIPVKELLYFVLGLDESSENIEDVFKQIKKLKPAKNDIIMRSNLSQAFRFIKELPDFNQRLSEGQKKKFSSLQKNFSVRKIKNRDWMDLKNIDIEINVLLLGGKKSFIIVRNLNDEIVRLKVPPTLEELSRNQKSYRTLLRRQQKLVNRAEDPAGFMECIELMEVFFDEKVRLLNERNRFKELLEKLGISFDSEPNARIPAFIPESVQKYYVLIRDKIDIVVQLLTKRLFNR